MGMSLIWRRWSGSVARGMGARGQPRTPSRSLKSWVLAGMFPYKEREKLLLPWTPRPPPFCRRNHSLMTSQELSFLVPSSCISGSGPSIRGVRGCVHHLCCFFLALEAMNRVEEEEEEEEEEGRWRELWIWMRKWGWIGTKGTSYVGKGRERVL